MTLPREIELYPHLKTWLERQGYSVHGEVKGCDIAAQKDGKLVLVEIKRTVNMELVLPTIRRQEAEALVYGAVPAPKDFDNKRWREHVRLFKRLDAGPIIVTWRLRRMWSRCCTPNGYSAAPGSQSPAHISTRWTPGQLTLISVAVPGGRA